RPLTYESSVVITVDLGVEGESIKEDSGIAFGYGDGSARLYQPYQETQEARIEAVVNLVKWQTLYAILLNP
ncbi:5047_t:CDS:1, partial [Ambispora gerdemannii]